VAVVENNVVIQAAADIILANIITTVISTIKKATSAAQAFSVQEVEALAVSSVANGSFLYRKKV
jgi:hypothetical protein